jgi:hypothetical protein
MFENRVLRRIFGPKRDEVRAGWRKLHNKELHSLNSSTSVIIMIESMRMRWAGYVARMGRRRMHIEYWWESQKDRDHYEDGHIGGWIILKWIFEMGLGGMEWIDVAQYRERWRALVNTVMYLRGSVKCWEVLE